MKLETRNMYPLLMGSHLIDPRDRYREKHDSLAEDYKVPSESSTFWTVSEKNLFFESLARFSIHRVDLIKEQLKDKSVIEIMAYYNLLKQETVRYKSNPRKRQKLLSMGQIPISYEMSEEFIQFEESQARLMQRCDTHFYNRRGRSERKLNFDNENLIDFDKLMDMLKISNMSQGKLCDEENFNDDDIEPSKQGKANALRFPLETRIILTNLAVNFTKRLILNSVLKSVSEKGLKRSDPKSNRSYQATISAQHIGSAVLQLDEQKFYTKPIWCRISDQLIKSEKQVIDEDGSEIKVSKLTAKMKTPLFQAWSKARTHETSVNNKIQDMQKIGVTISKEIFVNNDQERLGSEFGSGYELKSELQSPSPEFEPIIHTAGFNSHSIAIANPISVDELEKWFTERQESEPNEDLIINHYSQGNSYPFISMNSKQPIFTHDKKQELETKTFLMETSMLNLLDKEASLNYENVLLNYMKTDPQFVKTNDLDVVKAYIYDKYDFFGFTADHRYEENDMSHGGDDSIVEKEEQENESQPHEKDCETELIPLCYRSNSENFYEPIYFSEDNPFFIPEFDEITNDMIVNMSYEYSSY
ncbi:unnamed protein product [Ambrosiozyma monospora]|uniref:Unnamed protein product n=1 Tax=Ambrosiozyma monospora TaxID=43982 RepID=A0ACB5SUV5_AMBMO|nr:unnamed protein product [Ambrosiozyma monospora]